MAVDKKDSGSGILADIKGIFNLLNDRVYAVNNSKLFAGLMIIILNISSKFVTMKLSKSMESYLKHTFSRDALVFAIAWMGTRDVYVAFFMMFCFIFIVDYLFNEESGLCILPESFTDYHVGLLDGVEISEEEYKKAQDLIGRYQQQQNGTIKITSKSNPQNDGFTYIYK